MWRVRIRALALLVASAAATLGGCATDTGPSASEMKALWEAENVYPQGYRQDLLAFLRTYLNDPSHVRGASVSQPQLKYIGPGDRYVSCVRFNARNSDGKYLGSKDGAAIYVSGSGIEEALFAGGAYGSKEASFIETGATYEFSLYTNRDRNRRVAQLSVTRPPVDSITS